MEWERRKLFAVILACVGVVGIVYGGVTKPENLPIAVEAIAEYAPKRLKSPLLGNLLVLLASVWYGSFQVIYKKFVALPNDPELMHEDHSTASFTRLSISSSTVLESEEVLDENPSTLPVLPFGLHPNFFISVVGLMTVVIMALLFPVLHYIDVEKFMLPPNPRTTFCLVSIASMGLVFNAGFMVIIITSDHRHYTD
jgi:drug/metabolite transporter (DMT)-like permease